MSENVTHTAVVDDCARLACLSAGVCGAFRDVLAEHLDMARLGAITRYGDRCNPELLATYRRAWSEHGGETDLRRKLAFVLGWLGHRATDRQFKTVFRQADGDCPLSPTDCSIYHDVFLFRHHYADGTRTPYDAHSVAWSLADLPAGRDVDTDAVEDLLTAGWQRMLIRMHTFIPDTDDPDAWLDRVARLHQRVRVDLRRYAEAWARPDAEKVRRFITDVNFYDPADRLLVIARRLREGSPPGQVDLPAALAEAEQASLYARAVAWAMRYLHAASEFFTGEIDDQALAERLHIGIPDH